MQSFSQIVTTNKPTPNLVTGRMSFVSPNQQCRGTEGRQFSFLSVGIIKQTVREAATICPRPRPLTLKVVSESRVTWATSVPILVFLGLSVLELGPMYATDRQTSDAHHRLMPPPYGGGGIITFIIGYLNGQSLHSLAALFTRNAGDAWIQVL